MFFGKERPHAKRREPMEPTTHDRPGQARRPQSTEEALASAHSITNTAPPLLLVLDDDLRVLPANRYFYQTSRVSPAETEDCYLYELGNGQWNLPGLRHL